MKNNYYCLVAGLPDIFFEDLKSSVDMSVFREELKASVSSIDFSYIQALFTRYDNINLLAYLKDEEAELHQSGNLSRDDLEEIVALIKDDENVTDERIPNHFRAFITAYENEEPIYQNISWENQLTWLYYNDMLTIENQFVRNYFEFDLNLTNLQTALNCRKYDLPIEEHIIGDNEIAKSIRQSTSKDFGITLLFEFFDDVKSLSEETNIYLREQRIDLLKWKYLDENTFFHYFSIEKLFAFMIKLEILHRWTKLSKENGEKLFRDMLSQLQTSYTLPEDFILKR